MEQETQQQEPEDPGKKDSDTEGSSEVPEDRDNEEN